MRDDIRIDRLRDLSGEAFAGLLEESRQAGYRFVERLVEEWSAGVNRFDRPGEGLFAARLGEGVVGVGGLNVDPFVAGGRVGRVRRLYVMASHRRRGVGRLLVEHIIRFARGTFDSLRLRTNNPEAARFYEALGFRQLADNADATHQLDLSEVE